MKILKCYKQRYFFISIWTSYVKVMELWSVPKIYQFQHFWKKWKIPLNQGGHGHGCNHLGHRVVQPWEGTSSTGLGRLETAHIRPGIARPRVAQANLRASGPKGVLVGLGILWQACQGHTPSKQPQEDELLSIFLWK